VACIPRVLARQRTARNRRHQPLQQRFRQQSENQGSTALLLKSADSNNDPGNKAALLLKSADGANFTVDMALIKQTSVLARRRPPH
jgi:hypothetical protein